MDFHNRQVLWFRVYIQRGKKWNGNIDKKFERIEIVLGFFLHFLLDISCIIVYFVSI